MTRVSGYSPHDPPPRKAPAGGSDRGFGLVFAVVFAGLGGLQIYADRPALGAALFAGAAGLLLVAWLRPRLLAPFNRVWTAFGALLHRVVNPIVLGAMFYLVFTPMGLVMRAVGHDPLARRIDRRAASYWTVRAPGEPTPDSMTRQF